MQIPGLYILEGHHGRGVYTAEDITEGSVVEVAAVIVIPSAEVSIIHRTRLHDYYFSWGLDHRSAAIALGYGSLYNHSDAANVDFVPTYDEKTITFLALNDIKGGTELCIDYHAGLSGGKLWF